MVWAGLLSLAASPAGAWEACTCLSHAGLHPPTPGDVAAARTAGGWTSQGNPVNLTWSIVPDGLSIPGSSTFGEPTSPSRLIDFMDTLFNETPTSTDLTTRSWFDFFESSYNRWDELSGVSFSYETDDGASFFSPGSPGVRGNLRVAGHSIDGESGSNYYAYNYFPSTGNMVIDTDNTRSYAREANNYQTMRNTFMHEIGHGLGLQHTIANDRTKLMESTIRTNFDGPQFDDLLGVQRLYGDRFEENGGNDQIGTAISQGSFAGGDGFSIGADASNSAVITPDQFDFVSIDDDSDTDVFGFTLTADTVIDSVLTPYGPSYNEGPQNGTATTLNTAAMSDLVLELLDAAGNALITANTGIAGSAESILGQTLSAGDYFVRVTGLDDNIQIYGLDVAFTAVPTPTTAAALLPACFLFAARRRRSA